MKRLKVLLADDHRLVAEGLKSLVTAEHELVGVVDDGVALVEAAVTLQPDVIVADLGMPGMDGIEALIELRRRGVQSKVVILTMREETAHLRRALAAGASGYLLKHSAPAELSLAIQAAAEGGTFVTPMLTNALVADRPTAKSDARGGGPLDVLSPRQLEILHHLVRGLSAKRIAERVGLSSRTVEFHKYRMQELLGVTTTADLIRLGLEAGLFTPGPHRG
jgi:DNA-binding NarL/FixJ family response regulator